MQDISVEIYYTPCRMDRFIYHLSGCGRENARVGESTCKVKTFE
jgi:hypothetical protein